MKDRTASGFSAALIVSSLFIFVATISFAGLLSLLAVTRGLISNHHTITGVLIMLLPPFHYPMLACFAFSLSVIVYWLARVLLHMSIGPFLRRFASVHSALLVVSSIYVIVVGLDLSK